MGDIVDLLVDPSKMQKGAGTYMKSDRLIEKTLKKCFKAKLKSIHTPYDINSGEILTTSKENSVASDNFINQSSLLSSETIDDDFNRKSWYAFKAFAKETYDADMNKVELGIPATLLKDTLHLLEELHAIKKIDAKTWKKLLHREFNTIIFHDEYKKIVKRLRKFRNTQSTVSRSSSSVSVSRESVCSTPYQDMIERQQNPSSVMSKDEISLSETQAAGSEIKLKGKIVPVKYLKDAMVNVPRKHENMSRTGTAASITGEEQLYSTDESVSLTSRLRSGVSDVFSASSLPPLPSVLSRTGFEATRSGMYVSELVDPELEYNSKWRKMKSLRDARVDRELKRQARVDLIRNFKQAVFTSERSELQKITQDIEQQQFINTRMRYIENKKKNDEMKASIARKAEEDRRRLLDEAYHQRETLRASAELAKFIKEEEIEMVRQNTRDNFSFELDSCSSSKIEIPPALIDRVKNAKSLRAYESAKRDVKDFYEHTMSDRIHRYATSKGSNALRMQQAIAQQNNEQMAYTPILGTELFADHLTLNSTNEDQYSNSKKEFSSESGNSSSVLKQGSSLLYSQMTNPHQTISVPTQRTLLEDSKRIRKNQGSVVSGASSISSNNSEDLSWISFRSRMNP